MLEVLDVEDLGTYPSAACMFRFVGFQYMSCSALDMRDTLQNVILVQEALISNIAFFLLCKLKD